MKNKTREQVLGTLGFINSAQSLLSRWDGVDQEKIPDNFKGFMRSVLSPRNIRKTFRAAAEFNKAIKTGAFVRNALRSGTTPSAIIDTTAALAACNHVNTRVAAQALLQFSLISMPASNIPLMPKDKPLPLAVLEDLERIVELGAQDESPTVCAVAKSSLELIRELRHQPKMSGPG